MENVALIERIRKLPPEKVRELEDFVDLLEDPRDGLASLAADLRQLGISSEEAADQRAALSSFAEDWELPEMDVYDTL